MTDFPSYPFKSQAFKYLMPEKPLSCGASPYRFLQRIAPTPRGLGDLQSDTAATPWLFVAARKLACKSKDWKGFMALLLSKHLDEMYWFPFSYKDLLSKRKTTTVTFTQKPKIRATGSLSLKRKRKGSVFSPVLSSLPFLLQHIHSYCHSTETNKKDTKGSHKEHFQVFVAGGRG